MNEDLLEKIKKQEDLLKQNYGPQATAIGDPIIPGGTRSVAPQMNDSQIIAPPAAVIETPQQTLRDKIKAVEDQLGQGSSVGSSSAGSKVFLDEMGNETWYVKNISNGHVSISDMENAVIKRNTAVDLLTMADVDALRKSRDIRIALYGQGGKQLLKRLTPEEYFIEKTRELANKETINQLKSVNVVKDEETTNRIRPFVQSKLEKYNLSLRKETAHLGMPGVEFVEWALSERLNREELDFIIGSITDSQIRTPLVKKRSELDPIM